MNIIYDNELAVEDYLNLRASVGWKTLPKNQAQAGINGCSFVIAAKDGNRTVGMSRVLTDGGCIAFILDVAVHPEYQGNGIGKALMQAVMNYVNTRIEAGEVSQICLMAAKGKESFYTKFGFEARPNENSGAGMNQWIKREM